MGVLKPKPAGGRVTYQRARPHTTREPEGLDDRALVVRAIRASGLTDRQFVERVLRGMRGERALRRWLSGESRMPLAVRERLVTFIRSQEKGGAV